MVMVTWFLILIALPIIFLLRRPLGKPRRPPGPPRLPLIGNLLQYTSSNLHISLENLSKKYGPLMYMELIGKPTIVISSAKIAEEALKHNDLAFSDRPSMTTIAKLSYNGRDISSSPYSEYWREMRKMVVLRLFTHKQVNSFRSVREEEVSLMVKAISRQAGDDRQLVNLNEVAQSLSSSIICRVALGKRYDEGRRFNRLLEDIQAVVMEFFVADCFPWLIWIDKLCGKVSRLEKVFEDMDSFYQDVIDEHLSPNRPESMDGDILDLLIRLREDGSSSVQMDWEHIKGIIMDVSVAGSDTSAATITWAMTALIKKPSTLQKAQEEIRSSIGNKGKVDEDDIDKLPYLKAVVKETLRLYPPGPLTLRETRQLCIVNGYEIEAKSMVFVNLWAISRDPDYWENPTEFLPERFLYSDIDFKGQDFGFIPFGSGRRQCPGMALGIAQIEMALANILYSFDWELPPGIVEDDVDTDCLPGVAVLKKNALCLRAKNYQPSAPLDPGRAPASFPTGRCCRRSLVFMGRRLVPTVTAIGARIESPKFDLGLGAKDGAGPGTGTGCFFCGDEGHSKKEYTNYHDLRAKKVAWNGQQYFITFIDDFSRYDYIYLIHEKSQSLDVFKSFKAEVENQLNKRIKSVRSDHGGENYGRYDGLGEQRQGPFAKFLDECGIVQQYTMPGSLTMNGVAER
ncbi:cytochrome p450 71a9 [Phtheirospermum japonicum]|uniref:Cytochrome p450 71a9 n=1 Tax=Phtheirospermum japonicum TaxID=374723 RepID=A0A830BE90_9LAMI|nr:cytochrome p450 71a9 [Phtheirospermum japonicum]